MSFFFSCCWGEGGFGGWGDSSIKSWFVSGVYLVKKIEEFFTDLTLLLKVIQTDFLDLMFLMCLSSQVIN